MCYPSVDKPSTGVAANRTTESQKFQRCESKNHHLVVFKFEAAHFHHFTVSVVYLLSTCSAVVSLDQSCNSFLVTSKSSNLL